MPDDAGTRAFGWKLFCGLFCAQAGALFLIAALICFFAFNWADIPDFAKFGGIAALMAAAAALACRNGFDSAAGGLALLGCGLLAGPLLAVYGQVYQTGADAWELFRAWTLFLLPLALIGRSAGVWAALWLTASLWAALHAHQESGADFLYIPRWQADPYLYVIAGETAALTLWDTCAHFLAGPARRFLYARWLPRCVYLALVAYLTCVLAFHIVEEYRKEFPIAHVALYIFIIAAGAFWCLKRRVLFRLACGLLSLIVLLLALAVPTTDHLSSPQTLLTILCILTGGAYGAGKLLVTLNRNWKSRENPSVSPPKKEKQRDRDGEPADYQRSADTSLSLAFTPDLLHFALTGRREKPEDDCLGASEKDGTASEKTPWTARLLMVLCAWVAAPVILALFAVLFWDFAFTGFLSLCVLTLAAGLALSRRAGFFSGQISLCLSLAGTIGISILAPLEFDLDVWFLLPALAVSAISGILSKNAACRFIDMCAAIILFFLQCAWYFSAPQAYFSYRSLAAAEYANPSILIFFVCLFALFGAGLALVRLKEKGRRMTLSGAGFAALLILGLLPFLFYEGLFTGLPDAYRLAGRHLFMAGAGAGIGLLVLIRGLSGELALSAPVRCGLYIFCAAVVALSLRLPWLGCALFALVLARLAASLPMLGAATLVLAASVAFEYYSLSSNLLVKSYTLAGTGLTLLLTALLTRAKPAAAGGKEASGFAGPTQRHAPPDTRARSAGKIALAACMAAFFLLFVWSIHKKEVLLANGKIMILRLRPADPRSLMQGDYMILRFSAEDDIRRELNEVSQKRDREIPPGLFRQGTALMVSDKDGVCSFAGIAGLCEGDGPEKSAPLIYRVRNGRIRISSGSFFFQEGYGPDYQTARFAELRVDKDGNCLITRLLNDSLKYIEPGK